ncbi:MAG: rRNA maturation RNase YbeY [Burkholderiales bacterium]|jgi:probable rRNA maturation factor|nr:rRNA maturation RNase YbeY [Burkholderiales bacterium]
MSKPNLVLTVQKSEIWQGLPTKNDIRRWINGSLLEDAQVTVRLINEDEGRELNRYFRNRNYATNVLTFPYPDTLPISADIALCIPVIAGEAKTQHKSLHNHFAHLCVHAALHFQDFDHQNKIDRELMENLEIDILEKMGIPNPYEQTIA